MDFFEFLNDAVTPFHTVQKLKVFFEEIDKGNLSFDTLIPISENASGMGGSQVFLESNAEYRAEELIKSIVVASANDSCVAMAEYIGGSESESQALPPS